jgi:hypothetical protein
LEIFQQPRITKIHAQLSDRWVFFKILFLPFFACCNGFLFGFFFAIFANRKTSSFSQLQNGALRLGEVLDFSAARGDKIDVSKIDANVLVAGNQTFNFIGDQAFHNSAGEAFPFPEGSILTGSKILDTTLNGTTVVLAAVPTGKIEVDRTDFRGVGYKQDDWAEPLWFVAPPASLVPRWTLLSAALVLVTAALVLQRATTIEQERWAHLAQGGGRNDPSARWEGSFSSLLPELMNTLPANVSLVDTDFDVRKRRLIIRARAPQYGAVSDTLAHVASQKNVRNVQANKSQRIQLGDRAVVEFTIEGSLL